MQNLHIGRRARRRARWQRRKRLIAVSWLAATLLGVVPWAGGQLALVADRLFGDDAPAVDAVGISASEASRSALEFRRGVFKVRPTPTPSTSPTFVDQTYIADAAKERAAAEAAVQPTPTPTPAAVTGGSISEIIYAAAAEFGLDGAYLLSVAECESTLNPNAVNPAGYHGLFQFDHTTWGEYGYGSIYDPVAQSRTAARLLAAGQHSRWPNCA